MLLLTQSPSLSLLPPEPPVNSDTWQRCLNRGTGPNSANAHLPQTSKTASPLLKGLLGARAPFLLHLWLCGDEMAGAAAATL